MRISRTRRVVVAVAAATSLTVAGCSTDDGGAAAADTTTTAAAGDSIDLAALDTGAYNTEPKDFVEQGQRAEDFGPAVEGQRLAEFVVHPHTIDPALTVGGPNNGVFVGGFGPIFTGTERQVVEPFSMIHAFDSSRSTADESRTLGIGVWRFPTDDDAAGAAQALHQAIVSPSGEDLTSGPETPVSVPQLPGTLASTYTWPETGTTSLNTLTPRGMFVIYTYTSDRSGESAWVTDTAARAVQQQIELLDRFPATPTDEIGALPVDLDKVLARTVGFLDNEYARNSDTAIYGPDGWLHFDSHPAVTEDLFERTGTDRIAKANSNVYRTAGAADADDLKAAFIEMNGDTYPDLVTDTALAQDLPGTTCWSGDTAQGRIGVCLMTYGRYMAEVSGFRAIANTDPDNDTLRTIAQRVATQYTKFVRADEMGLGEN